MKIHATYEKWKYCMIWISHLGYSIIYTRSWSWITIWKSSFLSLSSSTIWANIHQKFLWHGTITLIWIPPSLLINEWWIFINNKWEYLIGWLRLDIYTWNPGHHKWHSIGIYQGRNIWWPLDNFLHILIIIWYQESPLIQKILVLVTRVSFNQIGWNYTMV